MTFAIRSATTADLPAVRDLLVATWHHTYDAVYGAEEVTAITDRWHSIEALEQQLVAGQSVFLVAENARGSLIGTAYARATDDHRAELARLYVLPHHHGTGAGRALLRASAAAFAQAQRLRLEVEPSNTRAIGFYQRFGFAEVARTSTCGGDAAAAKPALILEAPLPLLALRPARDSDAQDLFGLLSLCFAEYPGCFVDPHDDLPDLVRPGHWGERRARTDDDADGRLLGGAFLVVEDERGRVCACVALDFPEFAADGSPVAELHRLYVRPDCRGRGLAKRLTAHVEGLARAAGARRMILWSDTRFTKAHALYEGLGYQRGPTRPLGDISNSIEFFFEKAL